MPKYKFSEIAYNITDKKMPEPGDEELYIGLEHLDSGSLRVTRWGSDVELVGQKLVMQKGDILFGRRNTYLRRAAIAPHDGIFSAHGMIFRPNTAVIDPDYFPFFISSDYFMDAAIRISVGSLSPTVNWKTLKELEFFLPDLNQQRQTAELLSAANETKEAYQDLLLKSDELVKSQFIELFGNSQNPKYPIVPLRELTDVCSGGTPDRKSSEYWESGNIPWVKTTELQNTVLTSTEERITESGLMNSSAKMVPPNTILIAMYGQGRTRGMTAYLGIEACTNQACACILPTDKIDMLFLWQYFILSYNELRNLAKGSNQANLNAGQIKSFPIPLPPLEVQIKFRAFVEQLDKSKFELKQAIANISELMKSLIQQDFSN